MSSTSATMELSGLGTASRSILNKLPWSFTTLDSNVDNPLTMERTLSSTFNPAAASFNPAAPMLQSSGTRMGANDPGSPARRVAVPSPSFVVAGPGADGRSTLNVEKKSPRAYVYAERTYNPFRPQWGPQTDDYDTLSIHMPPKPFNGTKFKLGASKGSSNAAISPPSSLARAREDGPVMDSPMEEHQRRSAGEMYRTEHPGMTSAPGWGHEGLGDDEFPTLRDAHSKLPSLFNQNLSRPTGMSMLKPPGMKTGLHFTEAEWQKLGSPTEPIAHNEEIANKIKFVNQLGASQKAAAVVQPTQPSLNDLTAFLKRDTIVDWRATVSDSSDETLIPPQHFSIVQPGSNPQAPAFFPPQQPSTAAFRDPPGYYHPGMAPNHPGQHLTPTAPSDYYYKPPPRGPHSPILAYPQYMAQRYCSYIKRPSTSHSNSPATRGGKARGRKKHAPRPKRTDQGPMPSEADIYPEDARVDHRGYEQPSFHYEASNGNHAVPPTQPMNFEVNEVGVAELSQLFENSRIKSAAEEGVHQRGTMAHVTTLQEQLNRRVEEEARFKAQQEEGVHFRAEQEDLLHREEAERLNAAAREHVPQENSIYLREPYPILPPSAARSTPNFVLPHETSINPADDERSLCPSPLHSTGPPHSISSSARRSDSARVQCDMRPLSPGQLDGSRYGLRLWGIGLSDPWEPPKVELGTRFRVRPLPGHEGWGGLEWGAREGW